MKRATRINLILLGIVAALGIAVTIQVKREIAQFEPPLSALDPAHIERIAVGCLHCEPRRFERVAGHWMMRAPYALPADDAQVVRLLSIATAVVRSRRPFAGMDAKKIGLDPPLMQLDLDGEHFDIGTTDAFNGDRYVRIGDTIAMAPDRFSPFLVAAPASELDRHLVPRGSTLTGLRIDGVEHPELVAAWTDAQAARIRADSDVPGNDAIALAELQFGDGTNASFRFFAEGESLIARRADPPLIYDLAPNLGQSLIPDSPTAPH
jgi:hypothetical protein